MTRLFLEVLKLSLFGSLFALAVAGLRLVFRKAPRWIFCLLWAVAALALVLPVHIESGFSLVPPAISRGQAVENAMDGYVGSTVIHYEGSAEYHEAVSAGRIPMGKPGQSYVITESGSFEQPATVGDILARVWLGGLCLMVGYTAVSYILLRRKVSTATRLRENILESEQVESPFVLGCLRPRIYLPYRLDSEDRENVIAHERAHIHRGDHWWKPIGFLLLSIHWFNPVLWLAYVLLCRDIEGACDEKVIRHMTKEQIRSYSRALLNCSVRRRRIAACPLAFGEVGVKARIKSVMHYKKPAFWIILAAILASVAAAVLLLTDPLEEIPAETTHPTETAQPTGETQLPTETNLEERVLGLVDEIVNNPQVVSEDVYDYLRAKKDCFDALAFEGMESVRILVNELLNAKQYGMREMVIAAVCADITGVGGKMGQGNWTSVPQWLRLYVADGVKAQIGSYFEWDTGLLGAERVFVEITDAHANPNTASEILYSYRFFTQEAGGQETELMTVENIRFTKTADFDADGVVELFAVIHSYTAPFRLYDLENGKILYTEPELVPDEVLDYQMLIGESWLLLDQEQWTWFFRDPVRYIQEIVSRCPDNIYTGIPSGGPYFLDNKTLQEGYTQIHQYLDTEPGALETEAACRILLELDFRFDPETALLLTCKLNEPFDYERLLTKWSFTRDGSEEEQNCFEQLQYLFSQDAVTFMRAMAGIDWNAYSRGYDSIVSWLVRTEFVYDGAALDRSLGRMEQAASGEKELAVAEAFRKARDAVSEPEMTAEYLLGGDGQRLWEAFFRDTGGVVRTLGKLEQEQLNKVGQLLWGFYMPDRRNMEKCYEEVNRLLDQNLSKGEEAVAYDLLIHLEIEGGFQDEYVSGKAFDFDRFFDKSCYTDGATAEYWNIQSGPIFRQVPQEYMEALADWEGDAFYKEHILLSIAYDFHYGDGQWFLDTVDTLLKNLKDPDALALTEQLLAKYKEIQ